VPAALDGQAHCLRGPPWLSFRLRVKYFLAAGWQLPNAIALPGRSHLASKLPNVGAAIRAATKECLTKPKEGVGKRHKASLPSCRSGHAPQHQRSSFVNSYLSCPTL